MGYTLKVLQYFLIPAGAALGLIVGILLPRTKIARRWGAPTFWGAFAINLLIFNLSYLVGGGVWTRIIFAFIMGFITCGLKLLR